MKPKLFALLILLATGATTAPNASSKPVVITPTDPVLHKHGRWDSASGTWWAGSGFQFVVSDLTLLTLHLGNQTTTPLAVAAVRVDYGDFTAVNVIPGTNVIPIPTGSKKDNRVVHINMEGWENNYMHLERIELNSVSKATLVGEF
ncbi:hypothetical protein ACGC1H_000340 [Rhizoctonia solani]